MASSSLQLPLRKFEHFRVSRRDAPPTPLKPQPSDSSATDNDEISSQSSPQQEPLACQICHEHESRYTCPRCDTPYCSIACYRKHGDSSNDKNCTEQFYHGRVSSMLQLERKAKHGDTHALLNRVHQQTQEQDNDEEDHNSQYPSATLKAEELEELVALLASMETSDHNNHNDVDEEQKFLHILESSPRLKAAFEAALQSGQLQQFVLQPWTPWWRPQLSSSAETGLGSQKKHKATLEERLFKIPRFSSLIRKGKVPDELVYHVVEILYAVVWTLRLYHGVDNATSDPMTALDAASALLQNSQVLSSSSSYASLEEVLVTATQASTLAFQQQHSQQQPSTGRSCNVSWTDLALDVAYLISIPRFVARALLEAMDILQAATVALKQRQKHSKQTESNLNPRAMDVQSLRRKRKKLEYFVSWSMHPPTAGILAPLHDDIRAWIQHWQSSTTTNGEAGQPTLLLPQRPSPAPQEGKSTNQEVNLDDQPFLQEVHTTYRTETLESSREDG